MHVTQVGQQEYHVKRSFLFSEQLPVWSFTPSDLQVAAAHLVYPGVDLIHGVLQGRSVD